MQGDDGISIRAALPSDAGIFAAVIAALSVEEGAGLPGFTPEAFRRDGFGERRRFEPLVAMLDGQVAGIAILNRGYDTQSASAGIVLEDLYVEPQARRRGVGRALIAAAARLSAEEGGGWVAWHVRPANTRAQLFYRSLGARGETVDTMAIAGDVFAALAAR